MLREFLVLSMIVFSFVYSGYLMEKSVRNQIIKGETNFVFHDNLKVKVLASEATVFVEE